MAGKHYGENIIKDYSKKLMYDLNKKYSVTSLKYMRQFYQFSKSYPVSDQLTYTHYKVLLPLKNANAIDYYINITICQNLSIRQLQTKIKNKEYERLPEETKLKLINKDKLEIKDMIKNPIVIKNRYDTTDISEKMLHDLILEDITKELGDGYAFIDSEYKIKMGTTYNYIDILLFNYIYNAFVVVELKVTELKKEHIGQIEIYMNYIDENIKTINQDKTIGIIICRENNEFIIRYASDKRILSKEFVLM